MILYVGRLEITQIKCPLVSITDERLSGYERLRQSILQWGILDPVVCLSYREDPIVAYIGQQRLRLAQELGIRWVRTILLDWDKYPGTWVSFEGGRPLRTEGEIEAVFSDRYAMGCYFLKEIRKAGEDLPH